VSLAQAQQGDVSARTERLPFGKAHRSCNILQERRLCGILGLTPPRQRYGLLWDRTATRNQKCMAAVYRRVIKVALTFGPGPTGAFFVIWVCYLGLAFALADRDPGIHRHTAAITGTLHRHPACVIIAGCAFSSENCRAAYQARLSADTRRKIVPLDVTCNSLKAG
jgi:hypothetical protein